MKLARPAIESPYLTESEAAAFLRLCSRTLRKLRVSGKGPRYVQVIKRGKVTYDPADLREWMDSRKKYSTSDRPKPQEDRAAPATH